MADVCPVPGPADPLVRGLLATTDCHVEGLVRDGYGALFDTSGPYSGVLTALLTVYVGFIGYRLLLGRSQLSVSDFALSAVKLGVVLVFATQWGTYQSLVYQTLFYGPQQLADVMLHAVHAGGTSGGGDVFDGLQRAFDDLTAFSPAAPPGSAAAATAPALAPAGLAPGLAPGLTTGAAGPAAAAGQVSSLLSKPGFDSLLLLGSAVILLVSSLGLLLIAKIVLGLLLALGPLFIAMLLFESTRGLFEGWLRASLGFALAPLSVTLLLGVGLTLLEPSLRAIEDMRDSHTYTAGVGFAVLVLTIVLAGVAGGMALAGAVVAGSFKLPGAARTTAERGADGAIMAGSAAGTVAPTRVAQIAAAAASQDRRDFAVVATAGAAGAADDRRTTITTGPGRGQRDAVVIEARLGQNARRNARPREARGGVRSGA